MGGFFPCSARQDQDAIVGCFNGYDFDHIRLWVNSLDRCGFSGAKVILCAHTDEATVRELKRRNYEVLRFTLPTDSRPYDILKYRYYHMALLLRELVERYRYVVTPDVRDVIFQTNPSNWLTKNMNNYSMVAGSECLKHKDENFAKDMMLDMFDKNIFEMMKDNIIYNAGTMAGKPHIFWQFCLNAYLMLFRKSSKVWNMYPDQAVVNLLLHLSPYGQITRLAPAASGWACQAGTTADPNVLALYSKRLVEPEPVFDGELVKTSAGFPFCLVHQYDRVPLWCEALKTIYWDS